MNVARILSALLLLSSLAGAAPQVVGPRGNPTAALPQKSGRLVIGVMGAANPDQPTALLAKMRRLGGAIAKEGQVVLPGACNGLPQAAILGAKEAGGSTIGISPWRDMAAHKGAGSPTEGIDIMQFTRLPDAHRGQDRPNMMGRELDEIERSQALIFAGGRSGTLGEFSIAYEEGRAIGVLLGSGGVSNQLPSLVKTIIRAGKPARAPIIFDTDPNRLVKRLLKAMKTHPVEVGEQKWQG